MKKFLLVLLLLTIIGTISFSYVQVKADSGFDSSYDSGSSSSSSSSSSSGGGSGKPVSEMTTIEFIGSELLLSVFYGIFIASWLFVGKNRKRNITLFLIIRFLVFVLLEVFIWKHFYDFSCLGIFIFPIFYFKLAFNKEKNNNSKINNYTSDINYSKVEDNKLLEVGIKDRNKFLKYAYKAFVDVQNAWMEFDYPKLRSLLTDELYNTYHAQLITLSKKKQKNVMSDFQKISTDIVYAGNYNNIKSVKVLLTVSFYDYIANEKGKAVRGNSSIKLTNTYVLTFVRREKTKGNKDRICPSCGSKLDNPSSNVCPYCNSTVVLENHDWILSKKEIIRQE